MRLIVLGSCAVLVLAAAFSGFTPAAAHSQHSVASRNRATFQHLTTLVNQHRLGATTALYTTTATLHVSKRTYHGRNKIEAWWRGEFAHVLRLTLTSPIQTIGGDTVALVKRTTRGGDCAKGCSEQARIRFTGSHIQTMTLQTMRLPPPPKPSPSRTVVPPPTPKGPPPTITATIPT